jgi:hypothetical protein
MQKKTIEVDGKKVEVRQFIMEDLEEAFPDIQKSIDLLVDFLSGELKALRQLLSFCTDFATDELRKMGANDFARLVAAMKEENAVFFAMWQQQLIELGRLRALTRSGTSAIPEPSSGS